MKLNENLIIREDESGMKLLKNHSIFVIGSDEKIVLNALIEFGDIESAKKYLRENSFKHIPASTVDAEVEKFAGQLLREEIIVRTE
ncbi:MAG: hypothetical protein K6U80_17875 [Firmicutes bacterium]|nr:hypothetical protein [Bacillota bacterium]